MDVDLTRSPDEPVLSWPEREGLVAGSLAFSPAAQEEVKRFIARSRAWVGWWEFSARLFRYFDRRCSTLGINRRWATPWLASLW